jgi:hypothetical protein
MRRAELAYAEISSPSSLVERCIQRFTKDRPLLRGEVDALQSFVRE